jgi:acetyl esterase/lipase
VGTDIDAVAERLREITADAEEVVMIGNSAGGYAALLFGALLGAEVHAFSPQTFIDPALRQLHEDTHWSLFLDALGDDLDSRYADLLPLLAQGDGPFHVYYPAAERIDALHAERLADLTQVTLHAFYYGGHGLVRALRAVGWLRSFVDALASGQDLPAPPLRLPDRRPTASTVEDSRGSGMVCDLEPDSPHLLVTFGGVAGGAGPLPRELGQYLTSTPLKTIQVRDHAGAWYHHGVAGVGPDIDSVRERLQHLAAGVDRVLALGHRAGGHAALLFGALLGAEVHAFSPATFIDAADADLDTRYTDLLPLLSASDGRFHVYYSAANHLETVHAERLAGLAAVTLHPLDDSGDNLLTALRGAGWFRSFAGGLGTVPGSRSPED